MSHRREKRARRLARSGKAAIITAVSLEALCIFAPRAAQAQSAPAPSAAAAGTLDEVVVTGFRLSLEAALTAKRKSDLPIESVAPEDIGKMPDQNVAESLQRLPGVQIDRSGGVGTAVLIDGLRQNLTTLNGDVFLGGKSFYVSGEASGGGAGSNSQYNSLEGIPIEEVGGIDVYKNPKASMVEGGIGGTIDLKTRDPLKEADGVTLGGNVRATKGQRDSTWTPLGTLVAAFKPSDRVAINGTFSYDDEKTHTLEFQDQNRNQWLITNSATGPYVGPLSPAGLSTLPKYYIEPQLAYLTDRFDERKTTGSTLSVAVKATDAITSRLNWFYAREEVASFDYTDKVWFNGQGAAPGSLLPAIDPTRPYSIDGNGVVQNATFNANGAETATLYQHNVTQANNFQWKTSFDDGGPLRGTLDVAYSKATSNLQAAQADIEHGRYNAFPSGTPTSPSAPGCNNGGSTCTTGNHGYEFTYANGGSSGLPSVSYLAPYADVLNNPAYTTFKSNWAWANLTSERLTQVKLDGEYDPGFMKEVAATLSAGVRYAKRDVDQSFGRYLIDGSTLGTGGRPAGTSAGNCCIGPGSGTWLYYQDPGYAAIPYSTAASNPNLTKLVPNFAVGNILVKDPSVGGMTNPATYLNTVWAAGGVPNTTERLFKDDLSSFRVSEGTTTVYLMGDIGAPSNHFHINFGVRVVNTNLTIDNGQTAAVPTYWGTASWNGVDSNVVPIDHKRSYTDVLPSLNFVLDVTDSQKVRFSAARVVAPQDLFSLGIGNSYNFTRGADGPGGAARFRFANGNSGNTNLDPYRATQFYLAYENYFAPAAVASVGTFYKQVDNFVEIQTIPTLVPDDFGGTSGGVTQPVNAGKGRIYGLELSGQYSLSEVATPWLRGFGVAANYTLSQSTSDQRTSFSTTAPIPGVSRNSVTAQVYYERYGFSARASYSWRDKAVNDSLVGSTFSFPDQTGTVKTYQIFSAPYGQLDGQIGYDFNRHFGVFASVLNLTDKAQHTYLQWPNLPFTYDDSGRRYFVGVKGRL